MKIIVASKTDTASMNIAKILIKNYDFKETSEKFDGNSIYVNNTTKLVFGEKEPIFLDYLDDHFSPELYIFISKHASTSGIPTLTAHCTGVFNDDISFGGKERTISICPGLLVSSAVRKLDKINERKRLRYRVSLECTHHGPILKKPLLFIEVGSSEQQWRDMEACRAVADVTMQLLHLKIDSSYSFIGFGGPHYCPYFSRKVLEGYNYGHMCAKYALDFLDDDLINQMINKTIPKPKKAIIDWKGMNKEQRDKLMQLLKGKIEFERI